MKRLVKKVTECFSPLFILLLGSCSAMSMFVLWYFSGNFDHNINTLYGETNEWLWTADQTVEISLELLLNTTDNEILTSFQLRENLHNHASKNFKHLIPGNCAVSSGPTVEAEYGICLLQPENHAARNMLHLNENEKYATFQEIHVQTLQEFRKKETSEKEALKTYLAFFTSLEETTEGWYNGDSIENIACTNFNTAGEVNRGVYVPELGYLNRIDCEKESFLQSCVDLKKSQIAVELNGRPITRYSFFRHAGTGVEYVMEAWTEIVALGTSVRQNILWPSDDCIFTRENRIGWFGVGITRASVTMPTIATLGKIELGLLVFAFVIVDRGCQFAMKRVTRLGLFSLIALQLLYSCYYELDILRSIYSWYRIGQPQLQFLMVYLYLSLSVTIYAVATIGLKLYRGVLGYCKYGSLFSYIIATIFPLLIELVSFATYATYSAENGMQYAKYEFCPSGTTGCSDMHSFNVLLYTTLIGMLPMFSEICIDISQVVKGIHQREKEKVRIVPGSRVFKGPAKVASNLRIRAETRLAEETKSLTSFEDHCLGMPIGVLIPDLDPSYVIDETGRRSISALAVAAAGFVALEDGVIIRSKDLYLIFLAKLLYLLPLHENALERMASSTIVWPLSDCNCHVGLPERVYLQHLKEFSPDGKLKLKSYLGRHV